MGSLSGFMSKFGGQGEDSASPDSIMLSTSAPNALGTFLEKFSTLSESFWFYGGTIELRFDSETHTYFRVGELGNLIELYGVTTILKKAINSAEQLVPWGAKMVVEKMLRLIPTTTDEQGVIWVSPITLIDFTKLCMDAKTAPKDRLEEAGNIGKIAHSWLECYIQAKITGDLETVKLMLNEIGETA